MNAGEDFWQFSLAVYRQPGVPSECLALQESLGADVNLLLLCAYLGARRKALLKREDIVAAIATSTEWHVDVVRNLRAARQALKPWEEGRDPVLQDGARALRNTVKKLELDAERLEHDLLAHWANGRELSSEASAETAITGNIRALLEYYASKSGEAVSLPQQVIAAALSQAAEND